MQVVISIAFCQTNIIIVVGDPKTSPRSKSERTLHHGTKSGTIIELPVSSKGVPNKGFAFIGTVLYIKSGKGITFNGNGRKLISYQGGGKEEVYLLIPSNKVELGSILEFKIIGKVILSLIKATIMV